MESRGYARPSLLGLGVLLVGVAAVIAAGIALHGYITQMSHRYVPPAFTVYCYNTTIVVGANEELSEVKVLDPNGTVVCRFERVRKGSDEICQVKRQGVYVVLSGDLKRAVVCTPPPTPMPVITRSD